jgi:hypothetical protein
VQAIPLKVAAYFSESLRNHHFIENSNERENWDIATGHAQVAMFERVFDANFDGLVILEELPSPDTPADAALVLKPEIDEMQFATPEETHFPSYEAWIKYKVEVLAPDGRTLDVLHIAAYGKSPHKRFTNLKGGLNAAIEFALRDAGAKLSIGLPSRADVQRALGNGQ